MAKLAGKVAVISRGGNGLGLATTRKFVEETRAGLRPVGFFDPVVHV